MIYLQNNPEILNLWDFPLSDDGIKHLSELLTTNTTITTLYLVNNGIGDTGAKYLATMLKINTKLTTIFLWKNNIGIDGFKSFSEALQLNTTLTSLNLDCNDSIQRKCALEIQERLNINIINKKKLDKLQYLCAIKIQESGQMEEAKNTLCPLVYAHYFGQKN